MLRVFISQELNFESAISNMIYVSDTDPIKALLGADESGVLAIITDIDGPSYRSLGAMMAILADGAHIGTLSSGCIESDLAHHAENVRSTGKPTTVRYGTGSPFIDIQLPCGGVLEITLIYNPDREALKQVIDKLSQREVCGLQLDLKTGAIALSMVVENTMKIGEQFSLYLSPELRFIVFGKGSEALTFASLVRAASFENLLLSPDKAMCEHADKNGCVSRHLKSPNFPDDIKIDQWTAILLFFHDHDWEPPILKEVLASDAFFIGAQGSKRAQQSLRQELTLLDATEDELAKLKSKIGLIPSTRDSRTLAISVLADVLSAAGKQD